MSENEIVETSKTTGEYVTTRTGAFGVHTSPDTSGFAGETRVVALPGPATRPYGSYFDEIVDYLVEDLKEAGVDPKVAIERVVVDKGELTIYVAREHILAVARAIRDDQDLRFEMCYGVSGVHFPANIGRELQAVYHFHSITHNRNLRLQVAVSDEDPTIPSIVSIYPGNDWHERETWDLMGIVFTGHPGLTRSAMPDDWVGHPQRKDYPLGGIPVEYKGASIAPADNRRNYS